MLTPGQADAVQRAIALLTAHVSDVLKESENLGRDTFRESVVTETPEGDWPAAVILATGLLDVATSLVFNLAAKLEVDPMEIVQGLGRGTAGMTP